jgi:hypothetical protein
MRHELHISYLKTICYVHSLCPKFFPHNLGPIYKPMISIQCHFIRNLIDMHLHIISEKAIATKPHMFSLLYLNSCWGLVSNYPSSTYLATKLLCLIRSYVIHFIYILLPIFPPHIIMKWTCYGRHSLLIRWDMRMD